MPYQPPNYMGSSQRQLNQFHRRSLEAAAASSRQQQQAQQQLQNSRRHQQVARKQTEDMARRNREQGGRTTIPTGPMADHHLDSGEPQLSVASAVGIFFALVVVLIGIVLLYNAIGG